MQRALMVAGALALGLVIAHPAGAAPAGSDINVGIGLGGTDEAGAYYWPARSGISCGQGGRIAASAGFRRVHPVDCHGTEYTYNGIRHDGVYKITLKQSSGRIKDVDQIRSWDSYGWDGDYEGEDDYSDRGYGYSDGGFSSGDYGSGFDDDVDF